MRKAIPGPGKPAAIVFDFDGVIVDSEPIHLLGFRRALGLVGGKMSDEEYYGKYVGYDDGDCFRMALTELGAKADDEEIARLTAVKSEFVNRTLAESATPVDGAVNLIRSAASASIPLGICSGALREEILTAARRIDVLDHFTTIVAAKDVSQGKPAAEGYELAMRRLSASCGRELPARRCVAIEDSCTGIEAVKSAGMKVVAVATSHPIEKLSQADLVAACPAGITLKALCDLVS